MIFFQDFSARSWRISVLAQSCPAMNTTLTKHCGANRRIMKNSLNGQRLTMCDASTLRRLGATFCLSGMAKKKKKAWSCMSTPGFVGFLIFINQADLNLVRVLAVCLLLFGSKFLSQCAAGRCQLGLRFAQQVKLFGQAIALDFIVCIFLYNCAATFHCCDPPQRLALRQRLCLLWWQSA